MHEWVKVRIFIYSAKVRLAEGNVTKSEVRFCERKKTGKYLFRIPP